MTDEIEKLCEEYGFIERIEKQKVGIVGMVICMFRAYESFYGIPFSPPTDLIKQFIKLIIELSPEAINLRMEVEKEIWEKCINRVVEKIYKIAERELLKVKALTYIR